MHKGQYDDDATQWSPSGRLHQVEYALEAINQGSCVLGLCSKKDVALLALKRQVNEMAVHQTKVFKIDKHVAMGIAGLTADGVLLHETMRSDCLDQRFVYGEPLSVRRLAEQTSDDMGYRTIDTSSNARPVGVGILLTGSDTTGPSLYKLTADGNCVKFVATAIGSRSQAARTYFEKIYKGEGFDGLSSKELIQHGFNALASTLQTNQKLSVENVDVWVAGEDGVGDMLADEAKGEFLENLVQSGGGADDDDDDDDGGDDAAMDVDGPMDS